MLRAPLALALALPALAGADPLYVAGQDSQSVLEFDAASGAFVGVVAETITESFRNPGGIARHPGDGSLYVASRGTGEIWRFDPDTGDLLPPVVKTGLDAPGGIDFDAAGGALYFADTKDAISESVDSVKRLDLAGGSVTTLGTTAGADFTGVAANGSAVFAVDTDGHRIVRFPTGGGPVTTVVSSGLSDPRGIVFRSATRFLVADAGSDRVLEYQDLAGTWSFDRVVLAASAGVVDPCGLAIAPDASLTVTGCGSNDAVRVDLTSLAVTTLVAPGAGGLSSPKDAVWSGDTLFVASAVANAVIYFDASGEPTGARAQGETTHYDAGLALSSDGARLAVASLADNAVVELDPESGAVLRTFFGVCGFFPNEVTYGAGDDLFVSCLDGNSVVRIDGASGASLGAFVSPSSGGLVAPRGLRFGTNGDLFVSSGSGEVLRYDGGSGSFAGVFVDAGGNGSGPLDPYGMAFGAGSLYVASLFTDEVKRFDAATGAYVATTVPSGSGGLDAPTALAIGPDGDLYVASRDNDSVRRYAADTGAYLGVFVAAASGGLDAPVGLAFRALPEPRAGLLAGVAALLALRCAGSRRTRRTT
jgi:DNA-binding beta-propeller fold protein YncE